MTAPESESNLMRRIQVKLSFAGARLFRNNVALGWVGKPHRVAGPTTVQIYPGDVLLHQARPLYAGLCVGSSDLIGWMPVTITPAMAGRTLAVFTACEVKTETGKPTVEQTDFINAVRNAGGIAFICSNPESAENGLIL